MAEPKPIYKLFMGKFSEAWYRLTEEERQTILAQIQQSWSEGQMRPLVVCDGRWANEQWDFWGVGEFPNLEAVETHTMRLHEIGWFRHIQSESYLGRAWRP